MRKTIAVFALAQMALLALILAASGCAGGKPSGPIREWKPPVFPPEPEVPRFYYEGSLRGTADLEEQEVDPLEGLKRLTIGADRRTSGVNFSKPYGVAAKGGRIYVSDTGKPKVIVLNVPERSSLIVGTGKKGKLRMPLGIDADAKGNIYVVDGKIKAVMIYAPDGTFLDSIGDETLFSRPSGLAVAPDGSKVYVVDTGGVKKQEDHRIRVLNVATKQLLYDIGRRGGGPGEFNLPRDVALGPDGSIYVVDAANFRVQIFSPEGVYQREFGSIGRRPGEFSRPRELAVDKDFNVYVVDSAFGNFQIFDKEDRLLLDVGSRGGARDAPAKFSLPTGIAVDSDGRVYMVDMYFRKVDVFRPAALARGGGNWRVTAGEQSEATK